MTNSYETLIAEVSSIFQTHPEWTDQQIADQLNERTLTEVAQREVMVRYRTLISAYGTTLADDVLDRLETAAPANKTIARTLPTIQGDEDSSGVDAANPIVRQIIDDLAAAGVLTQEQAVKIKALGEVQVSRAEQLGFSGIVGPGHVKAARNTLQ